MCDTLADVVDPRSASLNISVVGRAGSHCTPYTAPGKLVNMGMRDMRPNMITQDIDIAIAVLYYTIVCCTCTERAQVMTQ